MAFSIIIWICFVLFSNSSKSLTATEVSYSFRIGVKFFFNFTFGIYNLKEVSSVYCSQLKWYYHRQFSCVSIWNCCKMRAKIYWIHVNREGMVLRKKSAKKDSIATSNRKFGKMSNGLRENEKKAREQRPPMEYSYWAYSCSCPPFKIIRVRYAQIFSLLL